MLYNWRKQIFPEFHHGVTFMSPHCLVKYWKYWLKQQATAKKQLQKQTNKKLSLHKSSIVSNAFIISRDVVFIFWHSIRSPTNSNPIFYTTITCLYHGQSMIKDLLLFYVFTRPGSFNFWNGIFFSTWNKAKLSCCHVILCEMNYELHILHYALINHNKILTRKPIQMQITVR